MPIIPTSTDSIKVGYIDDVDGYVKGLSIAEANTYARQNPDTVFIFIDGGANTRYLSINEVNSLTPQDLLRPESCDSRPKAITSPSINIFGGNGVGAQGNPIIDTNGNIIAVDIVNGGFGYTISPTIEVIDPATDAGVVYNPDGEGEQSFVGSGAVIKAEVENGSVTKAIVVDGGQGYLPPRETTPQYPALLKLSEVRIENPGLNYSPEDKLTITPNNGTVLTHTLSPFGKVESVKVKKGGTFTDLPDIDLPSDTGINASFTPVFEVVRDPLVPQVASPSDIVRVYDLIGLNITGYIDGKPYYGNTFYENGIKFAGTKPSGNPVRVYENRQSSIAKQSVLVGFVDGQPYYGDFHTMANGNIMTGGKHTPFSRPITKTGVTQVTSTSESTGEINVGVDETPEEVMITPAAPAPVATDIPSAPSTPTSSPTPSPTPTPTPTPTPSPTPPPPPSGGGGYGGY